MKQYNLVNNLFGWIVFAVAAVTYCMTVEPTASFWDCPEFITTANKLEVGHPPGAPFFMLTGNFFTLFASDPTTVAYCVNIMSALLSALCILFLFWTITHLARKLICPDGIVSTTAQTIMIMGAGLTGALAYTWSDTFWYSAVEGEVYAYSSFLTALTFWLILKWEDHADEPHSDRWLIFIFYVTGLSIGVHLLNLLCLPAIVLVYYFKKHPDAKLKGSLGALAVSALLVVAVLYGVVPGIVKVGGEFEWFFVNTLGMSFNSGMIIYILVLIAVVLTAVWSTTQKDRNRIIGLYLLSVSLLGIPFIGHGWKSFVLGLVILAGLAVALVWKKDGEYLLRKRLLNTSLLCMLVLMIGYSSYAVIVVRSSQNTPMDQNSPEDVFSLGSYLNREQYGDRPLLYGEAYTSEPLARFTRDEEIYVKRNITRPVEKVNPSEDDRYEELTEVKGLVYPSAMQMFFPRMYSSSVMHKRAYNSWLGVNPEDPSSRDGFFADFKDVQVPINYSDQAGNVYETTVDGVMPTQWTNLRFFLSYQINFMYWRYFLWNFAGRQNDIQGNGELEHGNFLTGIPFVDNMLYGDQDLLPDTLKNNKGHNVFYCLPLLLGLIGLFWQAYRGEKGIQQFWVVFFLFFMTGLAIVLYLNQTPMQPRERDYAYAGSFYAFAIWIGLGVIALVEGLNKLTDKLKMQRVNPVVASAVISLVCLLVPVQMVSQTWDDHDRSGRYACRDFGMNYLSTLSEKGGGPIIFTNGDNDTFPLWYAQEVEGFRTDARVCNLSYLNTDWYIDQMRRPAYNSPSLPIDWKRYEYVDKEENNSFSVLDKRSELEAIKKNDPSVNPYELRYIIDNYVRTKRYFPTDSVVVSVNKDAVRESGMTLPYGPDSIPDYITISLKGKDYVGKSEMMIYEMLARGDWKRPMYMTVTLGESYFAGLKDYLVNEGLAYRVTPFKQNARIDVDKMYDNMMNRFKYGNVSAKGVYLDETVMRMCQTHRHMFVMLATELKLKGDRERAVKAMKKCKEVLPSYNIPYEDSDLHLARLWADLGCPEEAARVAKEVAKGSAQYLLWAGSVNKGLLERKGSRFLTDAARQFNVLGDLMKIELGEKDKAEVKKWRDLSVQSPAVRLLGQYYFDIANEAYNVLLQVSMMSPQDRANAGLTEDKMREVVTGQFGDLLDGYLAVKDIDPAQAKILEKNIERIRSTFGN